MWTFACLSPLTEDEVRDLAGTADLEIRLVPDPPAPREVLAAVADADVVIADMRHKHRLDRMTLSAMTRCRLIQQPAAGFDAIDAEAAADHGIPVATAAGFNADTVADWTVMAILNVARSGAHADRGMRSGTWRTPDPLPPRDLAGLTAGIVGYGRIGRAVGDRLRAFGCEVAFSDPYADIDPADGAAMDLDKLLSSADIVSLHVPLNDATDALLNRERIARMKPDAILVNACRGPVVEEAALVEALREGRLGGAALDVFEVEPLAPDSPLRELPNVFLTPHTAGYSLQAKERLMEMTGANLRRVLSGEKPMDVVNPRYAVKGPR